MSNFLKRLRGEHSFPTESLLLVIGFSLLLGGCLILLNENDIGGRVDLLEQRIIDLNDQVAADEDSVVELKAVETPVEVQEEPPKEETKTEETKVEEKAEDFEDKPEEVADFEGDSFVQVLTPKHDQTLTTEPVVFKGKVSPNTKKVVVNALVVSNAGKTYNAVYTIKDFKIGDGEFTYEAKIDWKNLTEGTNNYHFTAFYEDGSTKSASVTVYYTPKT